MSDAFDPTDRSRIRRRPQRGHYDKATVFGVFDSEMMATIAYTIDGRPHATPTSFWREDETLYWHGSRASRMIETHAKGVEVCLSVARLDAFVIGRTGFSHSVNYTTAVAFGRTQLIDDLETKAKAMNAFIDRLYPGRSARLRPYHKTELAQISVIAMPIEEAAAKIREGGVNEREEDFGFPAWAGVLNVLTRIEGVTQDIRSGQAPAPTPEEVRSLTWGDTLQAVLSRHARSES